MTSTTPNTKHYLALRPTLPENNVGSSAVVTTRPKGRKVVSQRSKKGCFTCRARRLKCDETKPTCLRCGESNKVCEGYRDQGGLVYLASITDVHAQDFLQHKIDLSSTKSFKNRSVHSPQFGISWSSSDAFHARLGLEVLLQSRYDQICWSDQPLWLRLLAQNAHTNQAVHRAITVLGAVTEHLIQPSSLHSSFSVALNHQTALTLLQEEIQSLKSGPVPIFLASIVLTVTAILRRHFVDASIHLKGAFSLFKSSQTNASENFRLPKTPNSNDEQPNTLPNSDESLYSFAESLDLQAAWYALGDPPTLPSCSDLSTIIAHNPGAELCNSETTLSLIHECYHFAGRCVEHKYTHTQPLEIVQEQGHYLSTLETYLKMLDSKICSFSTITPTRTICSHLVLKVQCLSTFIYLSSLLAPFEVMYDQLTSTFEAILINAALIAKLAESVSSDLPPVRFQIQPGVFQPLYLTAMKYRCSVGRRRALTLLQKIGHEGPWDSEVMSQVAWKAIEIEEREIVIDDNGESFIPERHRLHGCGLEFDLPQTSEFGRFLEVQFSRCKNIQVLACSTKQDLSWEIWVERVELTT